ncbi:MAG: hypothetical protein EAZ53_17195 [Bacteroidetes bacterium]|nr:MAG: hypothetical protein EAZ53_17195 [Bacteroidota bacterium]
MDSSKTLEYHKEEIKTKLEFLKIDVFFLFSLVAGSISMVFSETFNDNFSKQLLVYFGTFVSLCCFIYMIILLKSIREHLDEIKKLQYDTDSNS